MIEIYHTLDLVKLLTCLIKLSRKQCLSGCEHLEIIASVAVCHQQHGTSHGILQLGYLAVAHGNPRTGVLPLGEGVVDLGARFDELVAEINQSLFMACAGNLEISLVASPIKDRLSQGADRVSQPFARIDYRSSAIVGPADGTRKCE